MFRGGLILLLFIDIFMYILRTWQEEVFHFWLIKNPSEPYLEEDESSFKIHSFIVYKKFGFNYVFEKIYKKARRMQSSYQIET